MEKLPKLSAEEEKKVLEQDESSEGFNYEQYRDTLATLLKNVGDHKERVAIINGVRTLERHRHFGSGSPSDFPLANDYEIAEVLKKSGVDSVEQLVKPEFSVISSRTEQRGSQDRVHGQHYITIELKGKQYDATDYGGKYTLIFNGVELKSDKSQEIARAAFEYEHTKGTNKFRAESAEKKANNNFNEVLQEINTKKIEEEGEAGL